MDPITGTLANQHLGNSDVSLIVSILEELVKLPEETLLKQFEQVLLHEMHLILDEDFVNFSFLLPFSGK